MTTKCKRMKLFLVGCIGARVLLILLAYKLSHQYDQNSMNNYKLLAWLGVLIGFSFILLHTLPRLRAKGPETFGEEIWWNNQRLIHGVNYLVFGMLALSGHDQAFWVLVFDLLYGTYFFGNHWCQ